MKSSKPAARPRPSKSEPEGKSHSMISKVSSPSGLLCLALSLYLNSHAVRAQSAEAAAASAPLAATEASAPAVAAPAAPAAVAVKPTPSVTTPDWRVLSAAQRQVLGPLAADWASMDPAHRGKWLELAARYPQLPAHEQERVQQRMSEWARLSPTERQQARLTFQAAQQLKADERQAKWEAYQALPVERRQELADKAAQKAALKAVPSPAAPTPAAATGATRSDKSATAPVAPALVPLRVQTGSPATGTAVLQARPGASTILITQGRAQLRQPTGQPKLAINMRGLDSKTLLPKPASIPAEAASQP